MRALGKTEELVLPAHIHRLKIIKAYSDWLERLDRCGDGKQVWYASLVTLKFNRIPGDFRKRTLVMSDEAERVYSTFIRHVVRNPRDPSKQHLLPIWILPRDLPAKKHAGSPGAILREVSINEGLHLGGVMLMPTETRMRQSVACHFDWRGRYYKQYVRPDRPLWGINATPLELGDAGYVNDYAMKSLKWKIKDLDDLLIFPKSLTELQDRPGRQFRRSSAA